MKFLLHAFEDNPVLWDRRLIGAMMTAFYMFRLYAMTFLGKFRGTHEQEHHLHESPWQITFPLIVLAILAVVGGWVGIPEIFMHGGHKLEAFLEPVFAQSNAIAAKHELSHKQNF
jgi:NADH-quinone oxidoreductase subunit L